MRLNRCLLLIAAALIGLPAIAQTKDIRMSGIGMRKCSDWNEWKERGNGEARATTVEWAQGFMSGHNLYARVGRDVAPSVVADTKILLPLLDTYCEKNAGQRILNGVIEITQSLGGAKINLTPKSTTPQENPRPDSKGPRES